MEKEVSEQSSSSWQRGPQQLEEPGPSSQRGPKKSLIQQLLEESLPEPEQPKKTLIEQRLEEQEENET